MPTNHGARHTTAHFPSRPKNHTAFLGLYGKVRRHPPCAVALVRHPRGWPCSRRKLPLADFNPVPPQIAESSVPSYGCSTSTRRQHTHA